MMNCDPDSPIDQLDSRFKRSGLAGGGGLSRVLVAGSLGDCQADCQRNQTTAERAGELVWKGHFPRAHASPFREPGCQRTLMNGRQQLGGRFREQGF